MGQSISCATIEGCNERMQHQFSGILDKSAWPRCNHEETLNKATLLIGTMGDSSWSKIEGYMKWCSPWRKTEIKDDNPYSAFCYQLVLFSFYAWCL